MSWPWTSFDKSNIWNILIIQTSVLSTDEVIWNMNRVKRTKWTWKPIQNSKKDGAGDDGCRVFCSSPTLPFFALFQCLFIFRCVLFPPYTFQLQFIRKRHPPMCPIPPCGRRQCELGRSVGTVGPPSFNIAFYNKYT